MVGLLVLAHSQVYAEPERLVRYELRDVGLLKPALGAPATAAQLGLHRQALERYENLAAASAPADAGDPQALVLQAGIGHEREYVRFWASRLQGADGHDPPPGDPAPVSPGFIASRLSTPPGRVVGQDRASSRAGRRAG